MSIRKAVMSDHDLVKTCARRAYGIYVDRIGREPAPMVADFEAAIKAGHLHVLAGDDFVKGFVVFYPRDDHIQIENVAVTPEFQGKGIGRRLVAYVEHYARDTGIGAVELYTNQKMTENLTFYPRIGYEETGRRVQDGFQRVFFRKEL